MRGRRVWMVLCAALVAGSLVGVVPSPVAGAASSNVHGTTIIANWGASSSDPCDGLDPSQCMLPFPNDFYTVSDASMPTSRRVYFPAGAFPSAVGKGPIDPTPWEDNDGFSPGSSLLVHVPGLSIAKSGIATISDPGPSLDADSPVVLFDTTDGKFWPTWSELDATDHDPNTQLLLIHPAKNLAEGDHYIVALRDLRTASGARIPRGRAFADVLSGAATPPSPVSGAYAQHLRAVVHTLATHHIATASLYLAWDFTVDSTQNISAPELTMRQQTFASLGSGVGPYLVTKVTNDPPDNPSIAREVEGYFDVPSYLSGEGGQVGSVLTVGSNGLPVHEPGRVEVANFECEIPRAATAAHPGTVGVYGHGLFNAASEVYASWVPQFSNTYDYVFCGTDWMGLSSTTLPLAASVISNLSNFPSLVDNLMQSLLDAEVLGRLLDDPAGFAKSPAFEDGAHQPLIRAGKGLVYYGNSEGAIMGGAFTALSTDATRTVLGVSGMDYDVLLFRSADFVPFLGPLSTAYPSRAVQQIGFDITQMLWDRADTDGYAEQMTTTALPNTPTHEVMLEEAFGDHQVSNVTTAIEARTIGADIIEPALAKGRSNLADPYWGIPALRVGSRHTALTVWDSGVPAPPLTDTPPTKGPDPHDTIPRSLPAFWKQMNTFFTTGMVIDPCGHGPCRAPRPTG